MPGSGTRDGGRTGRAVEAGDVDVELPERVGAIDHHGHLRPEQVAELPHR